jgi:hypothetical protein
VIVIVLHVLQRIKCYMREQSILIIDITLFEVLLLKVIIKYARLVLMTISKT